ncbi:MAG: flagellar basal body L-ring protein FlgH [Proteobacteria bacterium]|nr:flagellar basal body L-ring protein FlgH [Pseudomonadota bacterium]
MKSVTSRTALIISLITSLIALALGACAPHIAPYTPKHRKLDPGTFGTRSVAQNGSLYADNSPGLFEDAVASRVGDLVVVRIDEKDLATSQADTKLNKSDNTQYGLPAALGFVAALQKKFPGVDPATLFNSTSEQKFTGNGAVARQGQVTATLPVRVMQVLANGDLFIEGTKVVMVGHEEKHIYVSGIVRRIDIAEDNSVPSSRIADAEIEYTGRGDISDTQRRNWFGRALSKIWPF